MIADDIVQIAQGYLGQEESPAHNNTGFKDPNFQQEMVDVGWYSGGSWCAFLAMVVWFRAYADSALLPKVKQLMSGNSQQMARNFHADPVWPTSITTPKIGAMAIFGDVGSTTSGHTACAIISISADGQYYTTVEGNTIPTGNPGNVANGYIVATHTHLVGAPHPTSGLEFIRFIYAIEG